MAEEMNDKKTQGLYAKFNVTRMDGSDAPGGKHHGCQYFVLDVTHDHHALSALLAYADSCEMDGFGMLADDLRRLVKEKEKQG